LRGTSRVRACPRRFEKRPCRAIWVTPGHPDKLCDQISDAAVDAFLRRDPAAHAVVECAVATGVVFLAARFAAEAVIDLPSLARKVIADAGYVEGSFDARNCSILTSLIELPTSMRQPTCVKPDEKAIETCFAQDQANVFGYACSETAELMPLPITLAHRIARALDRARHAIPWLSPDGKTQVSLEYRDGRPKRIHAIAVTAAVSADASARQVEEGLRAIAIEPLATTTSGPTTGPRSMSMRAALMKSVGRRGMPA
jgi:S-adenosylmethionine synthetase